MAFSALATHKQSVNNQAEPRTSFFESFIFVISLPRLISRSDVIGSNLLIRWPPRTATSSSWPWIKNRLGRRRRRLSDLVNNEKIGARCLLINSQREDSESGQVCDETGTFQTSSFFFHRSIIRGHYSALIIEVWSRVRTWLCRHNAQPFCSEAEGTFREITPFGDNGFNMSAKWLFNDVEWGIITEL